MYISCISYYTYGPQTYSAAYFAPCFNIKQGLWSDPLILVALEIFLPPNIMPETDI